MTDAHTILRFLEIRVGEIAPASLASVPHGEWSRAYFFQTRDSRELVIRFSDTDADFRKDERAMAYASPRLPVPRILEIGEAFERFYAISERAFGEYLEERDEASMQRVLPSLLATLDAMRMVDISSSRGFGLWDADGSALYASWSDVLLNVATDPPSSRKAGWRERLAQSHLASSAFDAGFALLERLVAACPNERHLIHSDLLNFNVLVTHDQISSVLDWGSSLYGDFLWDLAWFTFWQPWYTAWSGVDFRGAAQRHYARIGLTVPNFEERMRCCELAIGLDGLAYQAFVGRADDVAWTAHRLLSLVAQH